MLTLYDVLKQTATRFPDRCAVVFYGRRMSYRQLLHRVDVFASNLVAKGIRPGDVVTVCLPNSPSATVAFYAINKVGAVCNLLHPYVPLQQMMENIRQTNTSLLIIYDVYTLKNGNVTADIPVLLSHTYYFMGTLARLYFRSTNKNIQYRNYERLEKLFEGQYTDFPAYRFGDEEQAVFLPSGGTTGDSKIIRHCCASFNKLCECAQDFLQDDVSEYRAMYSVLPIFHGFGLCMNMHMSVTNAVKNVMCIKFDAGHLARAVRREKINILTGVPVMYSRLLNERKFVHGNLSSLKECFVGGDSTPVTLIDEFNAVLKRQGSKARLLEGYGLAETIAACALNTVNNHKDGSLGRAVCGCRIDIAENGKLLPPGSLGEIAVSGPLVMLGYFDNSDGAFAEIEGRKYLLTGDYGWMDEEGYVYFKQRIKNVVSVNGVLVFPSEIESVVQSVEGVTACAATGIPDAKRGEAVKLFVQIQSGADVKEILADVEEALRNKVIVYAYPKEIVVVDSLPVNLIRKVDRRKLK